MSHKVTDTDDVWKFCPSQRVASAAKVCSSRKKASKNKEEALVHMHCWLHPPSLIRSAQLNHPILIISLRFFCPTLDLFLNCTYGPFRIHFEHRDIALNAQIGFETLERSEEHLDFDTLNFCIQTNLLTVGR